MHIINYEIIFRVIFVVVVALLRSIIFLRTISSLFSFFAYSLFRNCCVSALELVCVTFSCILLLLCYLSCSVRLELRRLGACVSEFCGLHTVYAVHDRGSSSLYHLN